MKSIPSTITLASKLIAENPRLFKNCDETKTKIAKVMIDFAKMCVDTLKPDEAIIQIELQSLTEITNP